MGSLSPSKHSTRKPSKGNLMMLAVLRSGAANVAFCPEICEFGACGSSFLDQIVAFHIPCRVLITLFVVNLSDCLS